MTTSKITKCIAVFAAICCFSFAARPAHALITWDGGGGANMDIFLDANWTGDPVVNSGTPLSDDVEIGSGYTASLGHSLMFTVDSGRTITFDNSTVTSTSSNSQFQPDGSLNPSGTQQIVLNGAASVTFGWGWNNEWILNDTSSATALNGNTNANGGAIGELSTIAFNGDGASFTFQNVPLATTSTAAWTNKMTVNGEAVNFGVNMTATSIGGNPAAGGSVFTAIIPDPATAPEPSSLVLAGLALCGLGASRPRRRRS